MRVASFDACACADGEIGRISRHADGVRMERNRVFALKRAPERRAACGVGCGMATNSAFASVGIGGNLAFRHRRMNHGRFGLCGIRRTLAPFREICLVLPCRHAGSSETDYRRCDSRTSKFSQKPVSCRLLISRSNHRAENLYSASSARLSSASLTSPSFVERTAPFASMTTVNGKPPALLPKLRARSAPPKPVTYTG